MKISNDQNRIELDDGTVLVAQESSSMCGDCHFFDDCNGECSICDRDDISCVRDSGLVIFIKEQPNAEQNPS